MKFFSHQFYSSFVSLVFHLCLIIFFLFFVHKNTKPVAPKYIEIGFGGTVESNSPGSPSAEPKITTVTKATQNVKPKEPNKLHDKKIAEQISDKKDIAPRPVATNNDTSGNVAAASNGNASGGNLSGVSSLTGSGNGGNGSGPAKKGIPTNTATYYVAVDQMPVPIGGMESINAKVNYPPQAQAEGIKGTVYVLAYIDENGLVNKTFLIKGIGSGCDQSAARAVRQTRFTPGKLHGTPVKVQMTIAVRFNKDTGE